MNNKTETPFWIVFWVVCLGLTYGMATKNGWTCGLAIFIWFFVIYLIHLIFESDILNRYTRLKRVLDRMDPTPFACVWFFWWLYYQGEGLHLCG